MYGPVKSPSNTFSIVAMVLGGVGLLLIPILGIVGIVFGAIAVSKGERLARIGLGVAIAGTVLGFVIGAIVLESSST